MVRAPYLPRAGETLIGEAWWWKPGGKGGNQAMAAARHGAAVQMLGCLGADDLGARLRERLAAAGVDVSYLRTVSQGSGMSVAITQADGDYAAVVVSGANRELDADQVFETAEAVARSHVLVLQNEIAEAANAAAARLARAAGAWVILNAAPARPPGDLAGLVDLLVVNAIEAEMLGAHPVQDLASAADAAARLTGLGPTVVVTAGAAGVAAMTPSGTLALSAHPVSRPDTHGAGDVFVGALAARLADGARLTDAAPLGEALRYANAAAALHVAAAEADRAALGPPDVWLLLAEGRVE